MSFRFCFGLLLIWGLNACDSNTDQRPLDIVWGRDIGESSSMVISDPRYAAQVIEKSGRGRLFVEIGTAIHYVAANKNKESLKIWVNDFNSHEWIDARSANWMSGFKGSPMGFGYRAYQKGKINGIPFSDVYNQVLSDNNLMRRNKKKHLKEGSVLRVIE